MSLAQLRGGIPYVFRGVVGGTVGPPLTGGRKVRLPFYIWFLKVRAAGNDCKLYFTEADFDADQNYVLVPKVDANNPYGMWEGPVETVAGGHSDLWLRGDGDSTVELVAFQRRG